MSPLDQPRPCPMCGGHIDELVQPNSVFFECRDCRWSHYQWSAKGSDAIARPTLGGWLAGSTAGRALLEERERLLAEVEELRILAHPTPRPLSEADHSDLALWWACAPIDESPVYIGCAYDSGWPFTSDDDPVWIPLPNPTSDRPKEST